MRCVRHGDGPGPLGKHLIACGAQLVHLDIKSANVLLQDATFAVAKLADLGVSKYLVQGSLLNLTRVAGARLLRQSPPVECLPGCTCGVRGRRPDVTLGSGGRACASGICSRCGER